MRKIISLLHKIHRFYMSFHQWLLAKTDDYLLRSGIDDDYLLFNKSRFAAVQLTPGQEAEIQSLWETHYGRKINLDWHRYYQSYLHNATGGGYDKYYFPYDIYRTELLQILTPNHSARAYGEKGLEEYFLHDSDVTVPQTLLWNTSGYFCDGKREIITAEEAACILTSCGKFVVKPTNSSCGKNVRFFDCTEETAKAIFSSELLIHKYINERRIIWRTKWIK